MPKAYSYIRFSTPEQAHGDSERRQVNEVREFCQQHDPILELDSEQFFDPGISATLAAHRNKGQLGVFLRKIKNGEIEKGSYLIVENMDRLSREEPFDALDLFMSIIKAGIILVLLSQEKEFTKKSLNTQMTDLNMAVGEIQRAHYESKRKSELIGKAHAAKRELAYSDKKPITSMCPMWLVLKEDGSGFEKIKGGPVEEKAIMKTLNEIRKYDKKKEGKSEEERICDITIEVNTKKDFRFPISKKAVQDIDDLYREHNNVATVVEKMQDKQYWMFAPYKAIKRIFQLRIEGVKGRVQIPQEMNNNTKYWTPPPTNRHKEGGWTQAYIQSLYNNRKLLGEHQPRRVGVKELEDGTKQRYKYIHLDDGPIQNYYPEIIDYIDFRAVQDSLEKNREEFDRRVKRNSGNGGGRRSDNNFFTYLTKCGYCGGIINMNGGGNRLRCKTVTQKTRNGNGKVLCVTKSIPYEELERVIFEKLPDFDVKELFLDRSSADKEITELTEKIAKNEDKIEKQEEKLERVEFRISDLEGEEKATGSELIRNQISANKRISKTISFKINEDKKEVDEWEKEVDELKKENEELVEQKKKVIEYYNECNRPDISPEKRSELRYKLKTILARTIKKIVIYPRITPEEKVEYLIRRRDEHIDKVSREQTEGRSKKLRLGMIRNTYAGLIKKCTIKEDELELGVKLRPEEEMESPYIDTIRVYFQGAGIKVVDEFGEEDVTHWPIKLRERFKFTEDFRP